MSINPKAADPAPHHQPLNPSAAQGPGSPSLPADKHIQAAGIPDTISPKPASLTCDDLKGRVKKIQDINLKYSTVSKVVFFWAFLFGIGVIIPLIAYAVESYQIFSLRKRLENTVIKEPADYDALINDKDLCSQSKERLRLMKGMLLVDQEKFTEAMKIFEKFYVKDPNHEGEGYFVFDGSAYDGTRSIEKNPEILVYFARAEAACKDFSHAEAHAQGAIARAKYLKRPSEEIASYERELNNCKEASSKHTEEVRKLQEQEQKKDNEEWEARVMEMDKPDAGVLALDVEGFSKLSQNRIDRRIHYLSNYYGKYRSEEDLNDGVNEKLEKPDFLLRYSKEVLKNIYIKLGQIPTEKFSDRLPLLRSLLRINAVQNAHYNNRYATGEQRSYISSHYLEVNWSIQYDKGYSDKAMNGFIKEHAESQPAPLGVFDQWFMTQWLSARFTDKYEPHEKDKVFSWCELIKTSVDLDSFLYSSKEGKEGVALWEKNEKGGRKKALELWTKAAEKEDVFSMMQMGRNSGEVGKSIAYYQQAINQCKKNADKGDVDVSRNMFSLRMARHELCELVAKHPDFAERAELKDYLLDPGDDAGKMMFWFHEKKNYASAYAYAIAGGHYQNAGFMSAFAGVMLTFTDNITPVHTRAIVENYIKAAKQGHAKAMHNLYESYGGRFGVPKDEERALAWLKYAADTDPSYKQKYLDLMPHKSDEFKDRVNKLAEELKKGQNLGLDLLPQPVAPPAAQPPAPAVAAAAELAPVVVQKPEPQTAVSPAPTPKQAEASAPSAPDLDPNVAPIARLIEKATNEGDTKAMMMLYRIYSGKLSNSTTNKLLEHLRSPTGALIWLKRAADKGNEEAKNLYAEISKTLSPGK